MAILTKNRDRRSKNLSCSLTGEALPLPSEKVRLPRLSRIKTIKSPIFKKSKPYQGRLVREDLAIAMDNQEVDIAELTAIESDQLRKQRLKEIVRAASTALLSELIEKLPDSPIVISHVRDLKSARRRLRANDPAKQLKEFLMAGLNFKDLQKITRAKTKKNEVNSEYGFIPEDALQCLSDTVRTKKFTQALFRRIDEKLADLPAGNRLQVVDAGCGPSAFFAVLAALRDPRVHVTAIETSASSAIIAQAVVNKLFLGDQISIVLADADKYELETPPDILISETMMSGFVREPFVQVMANLIPQCKDSTAFIPERVELQGAAIPWEKWNDPDRIGVFNCAEHNEVDGAEYRTNFLWDSSSGDLTPIEMRLFFDRNEPSDELILQSRVVVYSSDASEIAIEPGESEITSTVRVGLNDCGLTGLIYYKFMPGDERSGIMTYT